MLVDVVAQHQVGRRAPVQQQTQPVQHLGQSVGVQPVVAVHNFIIDAGRMADALVDPFPVAAVLLVDGTDHTGVFGGVLVADGRGVVLGGAVVDQDDLGIRAGGSAGCPRSGAYRPLNYSMGTAKVMSFCSIRRTPYLMKDGGQAAAAYAFIIARPGGKIYRPRQGIYGPCGRNVVYLPPERKGGSLWKTGTACSNGCSATTVSRPGQEQIIEALLRGQDVMAVMPTGAGKSVCYQVPALLLPGLTLVISPLISLMQDQVRALVAAGGACGPYYLNNSLNDRQKELMLRRAREGQYKIIYVAPERLLMPGSCGPGALPPGEHGDGG